LWLRDGRPAALGSIWSEPERRLPGRRIVHEFHALDREKLLVSRPNALNEWKPQAGLRRTELPGAEAPAATGGARLLQMRRLAQEFTGYEIDDKEKRWDMRRLPTPLYRYPSAKSEVVDGALFAFVSNAGTDPEVLLLIEARKEGDKTRWEYACARFSDWNLYIERIGKEVWSSVRSDTNTFEHDQLHLFRVSHEKVVTQEGKLLARIKHPEEGGQQLIPAGEK